MQVLQEFVTEPHVCHYLPHETAKTQYYFAMQMTGEEYEELMNNGHRKFGPIFFRPVCASCVQCRPIRVLVDAFQPSRSQRRALKRNEDLEVRCAPATVDMERLDLYTRYHRYQNALKGWEASDGSIDEYVLSYVKNPIQNIEISVWENGAQGETLRAVIHNDITPNTVSSVYHFHDPDCRDRSLGTFAIMQAIDLARRLEKRWVYLGYYVAGCASLSYKAHYRPCEILDADGRWRAF